MQAVNRGPEAATLHLLPTLWFRNTWSWDATAARPELRATPRGATGVSTITAEHQSLGTYTLYCDGADEILVTENETNLARLYGVANRSPYVKDAFHAYVVQGRREAVNPDGTGTKAAAHYTRLIDAGATLTLRLHLSATRISKPFVGFETAFATRQREADEFYAALHPANTDEDTRLVQRQALAGMLWSKQYYLYDVHRWLQGDPAEPPPPPQRKRGRSPTAPAGWPSTAPA